MQRTGDSSRRRFLGLMGALGLPSLSSCTNSLMQAAGVACQESKGETSPNSQPSRVLTARQTEILGALAEQIIPTDADPGARDAGVVQYIEKILAGDQAAKQPLYAAGLEGVDQASRLTYGRDYAHLSFQEQTSVLKAIEQGQCPGEIWKSLSSQEFFHMLWGHVLEGFYGPPEEGGNKNYASWKMLGFPEHSGTT